MATPRFASTLRYPLTGGDEALVSVDEEMSLVRHYLALVGLQLGKRLRYAEQVDPLALAMQVPRFCVQSLAENAIKHGLWPSSTGSDWHVQVTTQGPALRIEVRNSGCLSPADGSGTGWQTCISACSCRLDPGSLLAWKSRAMRWLPMYGLEALRDRSGDRGGFGAGPFRA